MRVFLCVFLILGLAGCTSTTRMADDKGRVADCTTTSFGIIGMLMAESMRETCVDNYEKQGFHQAPGATAPQSVAPAPQAPASSGPAKQQ